MRDNKRVFLTAVANAFLPEFADMDNLPLSVLSNKAQDGLQEFLDHHMGGLEAGTRRTYNYEQMNSYFGGTSILKTEDLKKDNLGIDFKTILGTFTVEKTDDGYNVIDTYNFEPRKKTQGSKKENIGLMDIAYRWWNTPTWAGMEQYETARMFGGWLMPEDKDRTSNPKKDNTLAINWQIPEGQKIKSAKLQSSVLLALGKEN
tara:strand:- start:272 stop:880 length:609 start_codon:yes stop_codon:yes gene_type:complete